MVGCVLVPQGNGRALLSMLVRNASTGNAGTQYNLKSLQSALRMQRNSMKVAQESMKVTFLHHRCQRDSKWSVMQSFIHSELQFTVQFSLFSSASKLTDGVDAASCVQAVFSLLWSEEVKSPL